MIESSNIDQHHVSCLLNQTDTVPIAVTNDITLGLAKRITTILQKQEVLQSADQLIFMDEDVWPSSSDRNLVSLVLFGLGLPLAPVGIWQAIRYDSSSCTDVASIIHVLILNGWEFMLIAEGDKALMRMDHDSTLYFTNRTSCELRRCFEEVLTANG